jgi:hypothetical protein
MSDDRGDPQTRTSQEIDRHYSPTSLSRRVDGRVVEQVSWSDFGAFYKRFDDDGNAVESRRATNADYDAAQQWSKSSSGTPPWPPPDRGLAAEA